MNTIEYKFGFIKLLQYVTDYFLKHSFKKSCDNSAQLRVLVIEDKNVHCCKKMLYYFKVIEY